MKRKSSYAVNAVPRPANLSDVTWQNYQATVKLVGVEHTFVPQPDVYTLAELFAWVETASKTADTDAQGFKDAFWRSVAELYITKLNTENAHRDDGTDVDKAFVVDEVCQSVSSLPRPFLPTVELVVDANSAWIEMKEIFRPVGETHKRVKGVQITAYKDELFAQRTKFVTLDELSVTQAPKRRGDTMVPVSIDTGKGGKQIHYVSANAANGL